MRSCGELKANLTFILTFKNQFNNCIPAAGPLAQSAEPSAGNAKAWFSTLSRTTAIYFVVLLLLRNLKTF